MADVRLDAEAPFLSIRTATAKNRRDAQQPLHLEAAEALRELRSPHAAAKEKVLAGLCRGAVDKDATLL
jgi:hypothetical protein